jgi:integrase
VAINEDGDGGVQGPPCETQGRARPLLRRESVSMSNTTAAPPGKEDPSQMYLSFILTTKEEKTLLTEINKRLTTEVLEKYSSAYQKTLIRIAPMAAANERTKMFLQTSEELEWAPRTMNSYWGVLLTILHIARMEKSAEDEALTARLEVLALTAPTWDSTDHQQFLSNEMIETLEQTVKLGLQNKTAMTQTALILLSAAVISLHLGQRVGDILSIKWEDVIGMGSRPGMGKLALQMTDTKITKRKGIYTLALPIPSLATQILLTRREAASSQGYLHIFNPKNLQMQQLQGSLHDTLQDLWGLRVDLRAFRRTGLSRLASSGATLETILAISKHSSIPMLERYLANGLYHGDQHGRMMAAFQVAWSTPVPQRW